MDFRIITVDGVQVLLERIEEEEGWMIIASVFVDQTLRFDEWMPCNSAEQARQQIADFPEQGVTDFLNRANEWAAKQYQRMAANIRLTRGQATA